MVRRGGAAVGDRVIAEAYILLRKASKTRREGLVPHTQAPNPANMWRRLIVCCHTAAPKWLCAAGVRGRCLRSGRVSGLPALNANGAHRLQNAQGKRMQNPAAGR